MGERLFGAEVDLYDTPEEKAPVIQHQLDIYNDAEANLEKQVKERMATQADLERLRYNKASVEIEPFNTKNGQPQHASTPQACPTAMRAGYVASRAAEQRKRLSNGNRFYADRKSEKTSDDGPGLCPGVFGTRGADAVSNATLFANAGCFRKIKCKHGNAMCKWQRKLVRGTSWRARAWGQHVSFQKHPLKTWIRLLSADGECRLCD